MKLRKRLLFLVSPLILLPPFFVLLYSLFFLQKVSPNHFDAFGGFGFAFLGIFLVIVLAILAGLADSIAQPIQKVIESAKKIAQGNLEHTVNVGQLDDETGQLVSVIEEMKLSLKQQKKANEEAAALSAIGHQAAQVAHDIRGPIASIQTSLDFFSNQSAVSVEFGKYVQLLSLSTRRLFNIAEDLVRKYRGEQDHRRLFSLHHILNNLVREFSAQQRYVGITFQCHFHSADICLFQERAMMERVFANLVKNALEAIGLQGSLTLKTVLENDQAIVKIEDDGCGIERDSLPLIFGDRYTSGKEGGTGLGLAYVKKTVEGAGGKISVESKLGVGTTFTVKLPTPKREQLIASTQAKNPDGIGIASAPVEPRNDKREYKVLVIDDDQVVRMGWELATKKLGVASLFAFENLEQLLGHDLDLSAIDFAFVDKNIKGSQFSGADCIIHLKKWGAKKIILASGEDEQTLRQDPAFKEADFIVSEKIPTSFKSFLS